MSTKALTKAAAKRNNLKDPSLLANEKFAQNPAAVAQNDTIANTSKLQPSIPEMGTYWGNADPMGKALVNGEVTAENAAEMTETWNAGLNGGL